MAEKTQRREARTPRVNIAITEEIIAASTQRDSSHCMIAEAVKMAVPEASAISVDLQTIRWTDRKKGLRYVYLTPRTGQIELVKFDQGMPITPFSFQLRRGQVIRSGRKASEPARLVGARGAEVGESGLVPLKVGGQVPPTGPVSNVRGKRRAYGLRSLEF